MTKLYRTASKVEFYQDSARIIDYLIGTGLYGNSRAEVIQNLTNKSIEHLVKDKIIPSIEEVERTLKEKGKK